ncbi:MAG: hypothetical protein RLZ75_2253, partial [Pseudomonadota bacterium]
GHLWSPSYFSGSCGGAAIDIIKQYIHQQTMQHESNRLYPPP